MHGHEHWVTSILKSKENYRHRVNRFSYGVAPKALSDWNAKPEGWNPTPGSFLKICKSSAFKALKDDAQAKIIAGWIVSVAIACRSGRVPSVEFVRTIHGAAKKHPEIFRASFLAGERDLSSAERIS